MLRHALLVPLAAAVLTAPSAALELRSPMKAAVQSGDAARVAALLDQGADLNGELGLSQMTPLKLAVKARKTEIVKLLLDRGADVNLRRSGTSALTLASVAGDLDMAELLLSRGAEVERRDLEWAAGPRKDLLVARLREAAARQAAAKAAAQPQASTAAAVGDAAFPSYQAGARPDDFALVVSVARTMDGVEAKYADEDAEAVKRHLLALGVPGRNLLVLNGERAGRAGLEKFLEKWLPNNVTENTRLFFYFAGCGASDPKTGEAYLLPQDADAGMLATTGYPLSRLYKALSARPVRSALAVIDASFAGAGERTAGAKEPSKKLDVDARDAGAAVVLLAASAGEPARALEDRKHGALTWFFLKGLNEDAGPGGAVTLKRVYADARAKVQEAAKAAGAAQTPQLLTGQLGESDLRLR